MKFKHINIDYVKSILDYNKDTGIITWKIGNGKRAVQGNEAGYITDEGYRAIGINGKYIKSHRIAWAMHYGFQPDFQIDHINGIKNDNRIINIRLATQSQNKSNVNAPITNTSGVKGVVKRNGRYIAQIKHNQKNIYIGTFDNISDAEKARIEVEKKLFGEFSRCGK